MVTIEKNPARKSTRLPIFASDYNAMKRVLLVFSAILLCSCSDRTSISYLRSAEALVFSHPDSALSLLLVVDPNNLRTRKAKAEYALSMSIALDKNYIDVRSDSLILKAVQYYSTHDSPKKKMLSLYYQGICLKNARELNPAMLALEKAESIALEIEDWLYSGLIYRNKAVLFNLSNNLIAAIENWENAITCFGKAHADDYKAFAELSLAIDYSNEKEYDLADSLLKNLKKRYPLNQSIQANCSLREAGVLVKKESDPEKAIDLFREVPTHRFSSMDYGYFAQAFEMIGERDSSDHMLSEGYRISSNEKERASLDYLKAFIENKRGNHLEAFRLVDHAASVQDSVTRVLLQQSVSNSLRDYYKSETALREEKLRSMRERAVLGGVVGSLFAVVLIMASISLTRKKDRLLKEQMARLAVDEKELNRLSRDNAHLVGSLFSEKIDRLDQLCESYYKSEDGKRQNLLFQQVKELATKIRKDDRLFFSLEKDLDRYCNGIMTKLRSQVPRIKGENLRVIMLFFAGFSYETVLIILNKNSIESLKTARSRYRKEIVAAHAPDAEFFLEMLVMKKRPLAGTNENIEVC